jgi:hypothetical protein
MTDAPEPKAKAKAQPTERAVEDAYPAAEARPYEEAQKKK